MRVLTLHDNAKEPMASVAAEQVIMLAAPAADIQPKPIVLAPILGGVRAAVRGGASNFLGVIDSAPVPVVVPPTLDNSHEERVILRD
jgi:hypothetical protein